LEVRTCDTAQGLIAGTTRTRTQTVGCEQGLYFQTQGGKIAQASTAHFWTIASELGVPLEVLVNRAMRPGASGLAQPAFTVG